MTPFNEGVSGPQDNASHEKMGVQIADGLSPDLLAQLDQMRELEEVENTIVPDPGEPTVELPTAEEMDLEKSPLPSHSEVTPRKTEVSTNLAETALSIPAPLEAEAKPTPKAEAAPEQSVDHRRHDSSRQHAQAVHRPRTIPSLRPESREPLDKLEATYTIPPMTQKPEEQPKAEGHPKPGPGPRQAVQSQLVTEGPFEAPVKPMPRKEFIKQQEELWGAKDKIAPEDVPEGEMTYEQYLAMRPKAEEGDYYHENGRIHDAVTGRQVKRADYEEEKLHEDAAKAREDHYETVALGQAQEEAIKQDELHNEVMSKVVRDHTEGEVLVRRDPHLQGLYKLGQELQELYTSKARGKKFDKKVKDEFEAKKAIFDDLIALYQTKGYYDSRAIDFIVNKTYKNIEDPDAVSIEGSAHHDGKKVKIVDFAETKEADNAEGQKTYTVEHEDGAVVTVTDSEVEFKREYNPEKETGFDRIKKFFKREGRKMREYGGKAYFAGLWTSTVGNWLTNRHVTEVMNEEEVQAQKLVNRRNNLIGAGITLLAGVVLVRTGMLIGTSFEEHGANLADVTPQGRGHEGLISTDAGSHHVGAHDIAGHESAADQAQHAATHDYAGHEAGAHQAVNVVPIVGDSGHTEVISNANPNAGISNIAYNIPDGGGLDQVFGKVGGIDPSTWNQHAQELFAQYGAKYPNLFYNGGSGVGIGIGTQGWLPVDVRQTIESFKG